MSTSAFSATSAPGFGRGSAVSATRMPKQQGLIRLRVKGQGYLGDRAAVWLHRVVGCGLSLFSPKPLCPGLAATPTWRRTLRGFSTPKPSATLLVVYCSPTSIGLFMQSRTMRRDVLRTACKTALKAEQHSRKGGQLYRNVNGISRPPKLRQAAVNT